MMLKNTLIFIQYVFSTFSSIFITFHEGTLQEYVIDERILKEMHYIGTGDLGTIYANVRYTEAVICGFLIGIIVRRDRDLSFSTV